MAKRCIKGYKCGNSCISVKKQCRIEFPMGVSVSLDGSATFLTVKKSNPFDKPSNADLKILKDTLKKQGAKTKAKIKKFMADGLTEEEAMGVALWISFSNDYTHMNRVIYNPESIGEPMTKFDKLGFTANYYAFEGLSKLPKFDENEVKSLGKERGHNAEEFLPSRKTTRALGIPMENLDNFLEKYKKGEVITENTFFATSVLKDNPFESNFTYNITMKKEGTNGVSLDKYKNKVFEGEVIFPPGQKFKVKKIKKSDRILFEDEKKALKAYEDFKLPSKDKLKGTYPDSFLKGKKSMQVAMIKKLIAEEESYNILGSNGLSPFFFTMMKVPKSKKSLDMMLEDFSDQVADIKFGLVDEGKTLATGNNVITYEVDLEEV